MADAVKLLTEAEAEYICNKTPLVGVQMLRERGLIAPEPVDPLLIEAREIAAVHEEARGFAGYATACRNGECDNNTAVLIALAALKRGMEMRPPLTRELVREAVSVLEWSNLTADDIAVIHSRLHAALTKE